MQSLTDAESAAMKTHLDTCAECRRELADLQADLALLSLSVEQQPLPAGARERFMNRIATESKSAAVTSSVATAASAPPPPPAYVPETRVVPEPRRRSWFPVLVPWAAAFALFLIAIYFGAANRRLGETLNQDRGPIAQLSAQAARAQQLMDALTSPAAQRATLTEGKAAPAPTGHTSYLASQGALVFVANNLRAIPASKTYELWIIPSNGKPPVPAGLFRPDTHGTASVVLPQLPEGVPAKAFGVTVENAEGATSPTLPIVLSGAAGL